MRIGLPLLLAAAALSGCTTTMVAVPPTSGTTTSSIMTAMDGGLIGRDLGRELDERDRRRALEAEYAALERTPAGTAVTWKSDGGRWAGEVVAGQPYRVGSQDCRQYGHKLFDGGLQREARGAACRNRDGSWTPLT